jgi:hypothetical protein
MTMAHAALGAAIGHAAPSLPAGVARAFAAHAILDLPAHADLELEQEAVSTLSACGLCAVLFGLRSREFWGAFACSAPDLEHVFGRGRKRRKWYPTHRYASLHNLVPTPTLSAPVQIGLAVVVLGAVARRRRASGR